MLFWRYLPFYLKEEPQRNYIIIKPVIYDLYRVKVLYLCAGPGMLSDAWYKVSGSGLYTLSSL